MKTRRSPKNQQRLYKDIGRQLQRAAAASAPAKAKRSAPVARMVDTDRELAAEGRVQRMVLMHREEGKKNVKFTSSQEWESGAVNAVVYVPKRMAEGVTSIVVTIER